MRKILLVTDRRLSHACIKTLVSNSFLTARLQEIDYEHAAEHLGSTACPDLIIYAPRSVGRLGKKFLRIKSLAGKARILIYSRFRQTERYLFDYLAAGANGILSTNALLSEQQQALDTVLRGDSFVDGATRRTMLRGKEIVQAVNSVDVEIAR